MKKFLLSFILLGAGFSTWAGTCNVTPEQMFAKPMNEVWCNLDCLDQMVAYVGTHSRPALQARSEEIKEGIYRGRMCASAYQRENLLSNTYWNDLVDRQNYILHQAGLIGSMTENAVDSDGTVHEACQTSSSSPCGAKKPLFYGGAIRNAYQTCMSDLDKKVVFTNIACIYRLENQMGKLSLESPKVFYRLIQEGKQVASRNAGPLTRKVILHIFDKMDRHVAGCHPEVKKVGEIPGQLDEVVVMAPKKDPSATLEDVLNQKVQQNVCTTPESAQQGQAGVETATASQGTGNGDGDLCPVPDGSGITVFIPCRRK